jgi:hypothetical protein
LYVDIKIDEGPLPYALADGAAVDYIFKSIAVTVIMGIR